MKKELLTIMVVILSFGNGYSQKSGKDDSQKKLQEVQELPCQTCNVVCNDKLHYFRLYSENDFWKLRGTTDRYFTNGIKVEYFFLPPGTRKGLLDRVFPNLPYWRDKEKKLKSKANPDQS